MHASEELYVCTEAKNTGALSSTALMKDATGRFCTWRAISDHLPLMFGATAMGSASKPWALSGDDSCFKASRSSASIGAA